MNYDLTIRFYCSLCVKRIRNIDSNIRLYKRECLMSYGCSRNLIIQLDIEVTLRVVNPCKINYEWLFLPNCIYVVVKLTLV